MSAVPSFRYFLAPEECMSGLSRSPETCAFCGKRTRSFDIGPKRFGCPECLQAGHFGCGHDTEIGMTTDDGKVLLMDIDSDDEDDFFVPISEAAEKIGISEECLLEFHHTPDFSYWNVGVWKVCCNDFMAYLGKWQPENFASREAFVEAIAPETEPSLVRLLWPEDETPDDFGEIVVHVFRCLHCERRRAQEDYT